MGVASLIFIIPIVLAIVALPIVLGLIFNKNKKKKEQKEEKAKQPSSINHN